MSFCTNNNVTRHVNVTPRLLWFTIQTVLKAQIIDQSEQSEQRVTDGAFISNIECEDQEW